MAKDSKRPGGTAVTADPRFTAVHFDPRFQRFPKAKAKVEVDDRFAGGAAGRQAVACGGGSPAQPQSRLPSATARASADTGTSMPLVLPLGAGMFKDPSFQVRTRVDKRGRRVAGGQKNENLRRYYRLKDEEEWRRDGGKKEKGDAKAEQGEEEGEEEVAVAVSVAAAAPQHRKQQQKGQQGKQEEERSKIESEEEEKRSEEEEEEVEMDSEGSLDREEAAARERWARAR